MNGSKSPAVPTRSGDGDDTTDDAPPTTNGHESPAAKDEGKSKSSPAPNVEGADDELPDAPAPSGADPSVMVNGADEDAASEAETLIDSPVKKREAEKRNAAAAAIKSEKPQKSRIGGLPVPQDDDEDGDSNASPMQSTELGGEGKATSSGDAKDEDVDMLGDEEDAEGSDEELSSARSSPSRESSQSRAASENPGDASRNGAGGSPNPRKRKHRASSVGLPSSKRRSMDPPARRKLRGMNSEDNAAEKAERSPSPKARGHRRAVSTQSALDGTAESSSTRKRRANQFPVREPKSAKSLPSLDESDASSETTSRGQDEFKRPQRGVGRSTSTPGRPVAREHKRHVNKYGFTRLAEACEAGDVGLVREWRERDPDQLELAEFAGNKPLQIAALNGNAEVVGYLIKEGAQTDCANVDKDTPLIDAAENGHLEVVKLLLDAGVDPLRQNLKGQQALDVVTDENEEAPAIRAALHAAIDRWNSSEAKQRREEEEEHRHRAGPSKELHFMARTYENLFKLVQNNDRNGVQEFLAARVPVDNAIIAAAAKTGDLYLVNMLLAEMSDKKLHQKPEKPMLSVLGTSHFEMLKALTELEQFNPLWRNRAGKSWPEMAEERNGPMWRQEKELLLRLFDRAGGEKASAAAAAGKDRRSSSPVTKRELGRRKLLAAAQRSEGESEDEDDDEDDEEEGGMEERAAKAERSGVRKRKNGRRLMSRKDLRTAKGGTLSDSDEGSSEDAPGEVVPAEDEKETETETMKPPETPTTRRRLRSKSQSGSPEVSPKTLRKKRSASFRGSGAPSSSSTEGKGLGLETVNEEEKGRSAVDAKASAAAEKLRKEREEEARVALELAKKAEEKRKEEEAAEAEAKRAEEEAKRKAEEEEKAEEERKAEELRREEELRLELARKEEEARLQREREVEEEKRTYRSAVLDALPNALARVLDPESEVKFEGEVQKSWLEEHFTPLRVLESDAQEQDWVLNLQTAALLGKSGLELFFGEDCPYFDSCLASQLATDQLAPSDWDEVERVLAQTPMHAPSSEEDGMDVDGDLSFEEELKRTAERYNALVDARRRLKQEGCKSVIRRVRLADILSHLHPLTRDSNFEVEYPTLQAARREEIVKDLEAGGTTDFVGRMKAFWDARRPVRQFSGVTLGDVGEVGDSCAGTTDISVVHEK